MYSGLQMKRVGEWVDFYRWKVFIVGRWTTQKRQRQVVSVTGTSDSQAIQRTLQSQLLTTTIYTRRILVIDLIFKRAIQNGVNGIYLKGLKVKYSDNTDKRTKGMCYKGASTRILQVRYLNIASDVQTGFKAYNVAGFV